MCRFFLLFLFLFEIPIFGQTIINVFPQTEELTLNKIAKSVEYIPLETNENCIIERVSKFTISENYILICALQNMGRYQFPLPFYILFTRTGKFVAKLEINGEIDASEYIDANMLSINEKDKQVLLFVNKQKPEQREQKVMYYGFDGRFIKSVDLPAEPIVLELSRFGEYFLGKSHNMGETPFTYHIYNNDLKHIISKIKPEPFTFQKNRSTVAPIFSEYVYNGQLHVRENMLNDTVYLIKNDLSFVPKYIINSGDYEVTKEIRTNNFFDMLPKFMIQTAMFETKDFLLFRYRYHKDENYYYYHKENQRFMRFVSSTGIRNDYDGGFDFWPQYQYNDELFAFYTSDLFEESKGKINKFKPQGSAEAIRRMDQLAHTIAPENNPILVIVKLK